MFQLLKKGGTEKYLFGDSGFLSVSKELGLRILSVRISGVRRFDTVGNQLMSRTAGTVITMNNGPRGSDAKEHSSRSTKIYSSREYSLLLNSS